MGRVILEEQAAPSTPSANMVALYSKAGGAFYKMSDDGVEAEMVIVGDRTVKSWARFDGTGTLDVKDSFNASVDDDGVGQYTVNFTTPFAADDWCGVGISNQPMTVVTSHAVGEITVETYNTTPANTDAEYVSVLALGDQ